MQVDGAGPNGIPYNIDGGNPLNLDGSIFLCGRSLGDDARGYDGRLAGLGIYNTYLTDDIVDELYRSGPGSSPVAQASAGPR